MAKLDKNERLKIAQEYAKSRGGVCLSKEYVNAKTKMLWKCSDSEHEAWEKGFTDIKKHNSWCAECLKLNIKNKREIDKTDFLKIAQDYAKSKGGECLSKEYVNAKTKMIWKCSNSTHKAWEGYCSNVISKIRWCQDCIKDGYLNSRYDEAQKYARSKGGECLSLKESFTTIKKKIKFKCANPEHESWESSFSSVVKKQTWCPQCAGRFSSEEYIEKAQKLAKEKGGMCLSNVSEYKNIYSRLKWKCNNKNHKLWLSPYLGVLTKNSWCKECKYEQNEPERAKQLERAKLHAISKGGKCLSEKYINANRNLIWKCHIDEHKEWEAKFSNVVGGLQRWCPQCAGQFSKEEGLKKCQDYARSKGGVCLSSSYKDSYDKLVWKCSEKNHKAWSAPYVNCVLQNTWCPECATYLNYKENNTRCILELLLGFDLIKEKPIWNINPKTGRRLELDGYNEEEKMAFEFQGRYHFVNIFEKEKLEDIQFRDKIKKQNCKNKGIKLLIIDDSKKIFNYSLLIKHVKNVLIKEKISFNENITDKEILVKINEINKISPNLKKLNVAKEYAKQKGGECLSESYINYNSKLIWKCNNPNHKAWERSYVLVTAKKWCPECRKKTR